LRETERQNSRKREMRLETETRLETERNET